MKVRHLLAAVVGAAALALPAAAHAVTYQPVAQADPSHYDSADEPTELGIDLTNLRGVRTASQFTVTLRYIEFSYVPYTRRFVGLVDPASARGVVAEYRTGPSGSKPKLAFYKYDGSGFAPKACAGARVTLTRDRLTFVIPVACYPGRAAGYGEVFGQSAVYTADGWTPGPLTETSLSGYEESDLVKTTWNWSGMPVRQAPPRASLLR